MRTSIFTVAIGLLVAGTTAYGAAPTCCGRTHDPCGGCGEKQSCQIVCGTKTVNKHCWVVECEEFCVPLPTLKRQCGSCESTCGATCQSKCGSDPCDSLKRPMTPPKCGKVRTRKKLVKKVNPCKVTVYKCVPACGGGCDQKAPLTPPVPQATAPLPPAPIDTVFFQEPVR